MKNIFPGFSTKEVHTTLKTFDEKKEKSGTMSNAEIWKMIKEFDLERITNDKHFVLYTLITNDEHKTILRMVNMQGLGKKDEN